MIHTNRIVTVGEQESIIDRPIILYRGDREVEIEFTLVGNEFTFSEEGNVIKSVNASHGQLVLNTPSGEHMFSELAECHEGKVVFVVTKEMIDEFIEMGFYSFQIRLYDSAEMKSRVTIPPVMNGFDIRNPIAAEDETNVVDQGIVDYARIFKDQSNEELPTFTWDGQYVKTEWAHHDVITENKMNKIEDALYSINANIKESDVVMLNALDNVKKDADKYVKEHMAEVENDVEEFERNLNTDIQKFKVDTNASVQQFKIDTNAAMTAHKNEVRDELESFDERLVHNEKHLDDIFININKYEKRIINNDLTEVLQELVNEHSKIYIPSGEYTLSNLTIPSNTEIVCSSEAIITVNGTISNKVDIIKDWSIKSDNPVNTGDTIITLSDTSLLNQVSVGDTVRLYNNGWMTEDEWVVESDKENVEFKSWQIAVVKNVGDDNIELDSPIEFSSDVIIIYYQNQSENIKICGGKWITNSSKTININKCKNLQLCDMVIDNKAVTVPLYLEYIYDSKIKCLNMTSISNTCIWVARGSKNVKISDNVCKVKDEFSGDATIMVFDSCKYVDVYNNELELNHYGAPNQGKIKIGICIHTVSTFCNVYNNYVKGFSHGLASYFGAKHNIFRNNTAELCGTGMYLHKSSYTKICSNIFRRCNDSRLVYGSVTGGVSFQLNSSNYKIDIIENIFIETGKGINAGSYLTDCNFNGNTFVNCLGITSGTSNVNHKRINIAYNKFINSENSKHRGIDYYPTGRNVNINNNTFENVTDAMRMYGNMQFSNIYCNSCMNAERFLQLRQNGYGNQIFNNIINTAVLGFGQEDPASLNNFYNNVLLDVETHYNFTDSYNMSKQTYRGYMPIGFRCYSIDPTSDYIYYEKITEGNTLACWQKVKKYI